MTEPRQDISDGYHTFTELYEHRILLYLNLVATLPFEKAWKPHYPEWPVLFIELPTGQISYHFHKRFLSLVEKIAPRIDDYLWDGHTSGDVVTRLNKYLEERA